MPTVGAPVTSKYTSPAHFASPFGPSIQRLLCPMAQAPHMQPVKQGPNWFSPHLPTQTFSTDFQYLFWTLPWPLPLLLSHPLPKPITLTT